MTSKTNSDIALGDVRSTSFDAASANLVGYVGTIEDALAQIRAEDDVVRPYWPLNFLPGWVVGALLLWASVELLGWIWWPRRWR